MSFSFLSNSIRPSENVGEGFDKNALLHILIHSIVLVVKPSLSVFLV